MSYDGVSRETIISIWPELEDISYEVYNQLEIEAKYSGYIKRQLADIEVFKKDEKLKIREDIDYQKMVLILTELGFTVDSEGNIFWD
jgi:tRNA uridine 5-carboxymethylaminomethyl modification enzyme